MIKDRYIPYFLLLIFVIPFTLLGFDQGTEIKIKEIVIFFLFISFLFQHFMGKKIYIDNAAKYYFFFIVTCLFYFFIELIKDYSINNFLFLTHILLFVFINFLIYFLVFNLNLKKFNIGNFINLIFFIYVCIFIYFISYSYTIYEIAQSNSLHFYTMEGNLLQDGEIKIYMGGTNGKSWFFLFLSLFIHSFLKNKCSYILAFIVICMSILVAHLLLSRGATYTGIGFLIFYLISIIKTKNSKLILYFIIFSITLSSFFNFYYKNNSIDDLNIKSTFESKIGLSNRDKLIIDSVNVIIDNFFFGKGFHYTSMNKKQLKLDGYDYLGSNNPQNSLLNIFIDIGIIGFLLFVLIWLALFKNISNFINEKKNISVEYCYIAGIRTMIIGIIISFFFNHQFEKNLFSTPILLLMISLASNIIYLKNSKIN